MQDGNRLREQVSEMTMRAEVRAAVAKDHQKIVVERKIQADREIQKLRLLANVFAMGEQLLRQKKKQLFDEGETPTETELGGLEDAITNVVRLGQEAQRALSHNEGALGALTAMETTFQQQALEATSRARGMETQGQRAIDIADSRPVSQTAQGAAQSLEEVPLISSVQGVGAVSGIFEIP